MPKITSSIKQARFSQVVSKNVMEDFDAAMNAATKSGLRVDVQTDVEQLLKRLTKIINDAATECEKPAKENGDEQPIV